jgi:hypothetical protein
VVDQNRWPFYRVAPRQQTRPIAVGDSAGDDDGTGRRAHGRRRVCYTALAEKGIVMFIPGKWYVFFPKDFGDSPQAGPFDAEEQADRWLTLVSVLDDGEVWQCPLNPPGGNVAFRLESVPGASSVAVPPAGH